MKIYAITEITNENTLLKEALKSGSRSFLLSEKTNSGIDVCTFPQTVESARTEKTTAIVFLQII